MCHWVSSDPWKPDEGVMATLSCLQQPLSSCRLTPAALMESVHLIRGLSRCLLPSILPSITVFSKELCLPHFLGADLQCPPSWGSGSGCKMDREPQGGALITLLPVVTQPWVILVQRPRETPNGAPRPRCGWQRHHDKCCQVSFKSSPALPTLHPVVQGHPSGHPKRSSWDWM